MKFSKNLIILLFSVFLVYSCGSSQGENNENAKPDSVSQAGDSLKNEQGKDAGIKKDEKKDESIPVEITTIRRGSISDYILLSANLETEEMADVYSRVQGIVEKVHVFEGDYVKKGQVMMELEAEEYRLAAEKAKLNYLKQKSDFERLENMFEKELLSKEEFEQAKYTTEALRIDWEQANLNLSYTRITSPISGVIGDRFVKPGQRIQPTNRLYTVINTEEMIAVVYVPEKQIGTIRPGQRAYLTSDNLGNVQFSGSIKRVSPVIDPASGTFKVTIAVKNTANTLRSGMFVNAHIITDTHDNAALVPKTAIVYENEKMYVFVVKDSLAHKIEIKPGFQDHEKIEAMTDIESGDKVIVVGQSGLKDQTKVRIVSERKNLLNLSAVFYGRQRGL